MEKENSLIRVYTGSETSVILLKEKLTENGIRALVKNDSSDSFLLAAPGAVDLYILETDYKKALPVLRAFKKNMGSL